MFYENHVIHCSAKITQKDKRHTNDIYLLFLFGSTTHNVNGKESPPPKIRLNQNPLHEYFLRISFLNVCNTLRHKRITFMYTLMCVYEADSKHLLYHI